MSSIIRVNDIQDAGGNSIISSNGSGTVTVGNTALKNTPLILFIRLGIDFFGET